MGFLFTPSSGASIPSATRTVAGKARATVFNVLDYGAVGDGTTDDAVAIQSAVTAAASVNGCVYVPGGYTYLLGTSILLTAPLTIRGDNWGSVLKLKAGTNIFAFVFNGGGTGATIFNICIRDLTIDGNNGSQTASAGTGGGISAVGAVHCNFTNMRVRNSAEVGLWIQGQSSGVTSLAVNAPGTGYTSAPTVTISAPTSGIGTTATATATVAGNVLIGFTITAAGSGYTVNPTVSMTGGGGSGGTASVGINSTYGHNNNVTDCLFDNGNAALGTSNGQGIRINSSDENQMVGCDFEYNGNASAANPIHSWDMSGLNYWTSCNYVNGGIGIKVESASKSRIVACNFDGCGQDAIFLTGSNCVVVGNTITEPGHGGTANAYSGIRMSFAGGGHVITGNQIISITPTNTRSAIRESTGGPTKPSIIVGNMIDQSSIAFGTAIVENGAIGSRFAQNGGFVTDATGTATVAVAASTVTVNHGLVSTPTEVDLTPTNDPQQRYWVSGITATQFVVNLAAAAVTTAPTFQWRCQTSEG